MHFLFLLIFVVALVFQTTFVNVRVVDSRYVRSEGMGNSSPLHCGVLVYWMRRKMRWSEFSLEVSWYRAPFECQCVERSVLSVSYSFSTLALSNNISVLLLLVVSLCNFFVVIPCFFWCRPAIPIFFAGLSVRRFCHAVCARQVESSATLRCYFVLKLTPTIFSFPTPNTVTVLFGSVTFGARGILLLHNTKTFTILLVL